MKRLRNVMDAVFKFLVSSHSSDQELLKLEMKKTINLEEKMLMEKLFNQGH
ncbi:hypothetical protein HBN50_08830 [Halobacteriovorax sp. GB3]|uniref:hypothetical protein n=1 Tax=Halobacteriovorax sp. GB3 TaxID=2719615 RepID=UPI00235E3753|nr:hypothetical protein [Halobacteriovorax sp. GB3]MDD0853200.1 hypothetical protein [Halobacteriovorax sp. GB3]